MGTHNSIALFANLSASGSFHSLDVTFPSTTEKIIFRYGFTDDDEFWAWLNSAKVEYEANNNEIIIGDDGTVNLGDNN